MAESIPYLRSTTHSQQLIVHNEPFLILGGEVQNSQFSSAEYMKPIWPRLKASNLNTVFGSVSWEQIEPIEGKFDFSQITQIVLDARAHHLHLVLLWFGAFKNGVSTYAPAWVKQSPSRFPRAELHHPHVISDVLSLFHPAARNADAAAFSALMTHLSALDAQHSTILMVQVENEVGLLGDSRDRSSRAEAAFRQTIPPEFLSWIQSDWESMNEPFRKTFGALSCASKSSLAWEEIAAPKAQVDELFMAYHYAMYVEEIAVAGKRQFPLPLYTNVWQNYAGEDRDEEAAPIVAAGGGEPGDYPCGGGVGSVLDVWKRFAPSVDIIAPDIYLNDYAKTCKVYAGYKGQGLLIPEQRRDEYGARRVWEAFGTYRAIGTAPFGIDTMKEDEDVFRRHYGLLTKVKKHVLEAQTRENGSVGFFFDEIREGGGDRKERKEVVFGNWKLVIERAFVFGRPGPGCGMVIHQGDDKFLLTGWGFQVQFEPVRSRVRFTGLLRVEEKEVDDSQTGHLRTVRMLNGDETRSGKTVVMPNEDPDYGGFPISITIPANTGITACKPYALYEEDLELKN